MAKKDKRTFHDRMNHFHAAQGVFIGIYLGFIFIIEPIEIEILLGIIMFGIYFLLDRGFNAVNGALQAELAENRKLIAELQKELKPAKKKTVKKATKKPAKKTAKKKK